MEDMPSKKMPFTMTQRNNETFRGMPLIETAICINSLLALHEKCLHYTQTNNESFRKYARYRRRGMGQKLIISSGNMPFNITDCQRIFSEICPHRNWDMEDMPSMKMPFTIHRETTKRFEVCPLQEPPYVSKVY